MQRLCCHHSACGTYMHALVSDALVCRELAGAEEATAVGAAEDVVVVPDAVLADP